jgi:hypothetical protein
MMAVPAAVEQVQLVATQPLQVAVTAALVARLVLADQVLLMRVAAVVLAVQDWVAVMAVAALVGARQRVPQILATLEHLTQVGVVLVILMDQITLLLDILAGKAGLAL